MLDATDPNRLPPSIHAAFSPTMGICAGAPVTFWVRTFRTTEGEETWDFGDGSAPVTVKSDGNVKPLAADGYAKTTHAFAKPGTYLARVQRTDGNGFTATAGITEDFFSRPRAVGTEMRPPETRDFASFPLSGFVPSTIHSRIAV